MKSKTTIRALILLAIWTTTVHAEVSISDELGVPDVKSMDRKVLEILCSNLMVRIRSVEAEIAELKTPPPAAPLALEPEASEAESAREIAGPVEEGETDAIRRKIEEATRAEIVYLTGKIAEDEVKLRKNRRSRNRDPQWFLAAQAEMLATRRSDLRAYKNGKKYFIPSFAQTRTPLGIGGIGRFVANGHLRVARAAEVLEDNIVVVELFQKDPRTLPAQFRQMLSRIPRPTRTLRPDTKVATVMVQLDSVVGILPGQEIELSGVYTADEVRPLARGGRTYQLFLLKPIDTLVVEQVLASMMPDHK